MPRISKREKIQDSFMKEQGNAVNVEVENKDAAIYTTVGYSRLSRLNSGGDDEDTIENQRKSIDTFVEARDDMKFVRHYSDNGFTGSDFCRPGWQELMKDVSSGKANCIVFKDLSRLGRNFLETSEYLEQVFPEMGVRVISVLDDYDSNAPVRDENGILIPLKNLMNDMYSKDIRAKGEAVRKRKMKEGEYTRAVAPYGYVRAGDKNNTLQIDHEAAEVIRLIFKWRKEEQLSTIAIATRLNQMQVMPPKKYQHIKGLRMTKDNLDDMNWTSVTIRRMLANKVYCGYLIQGKVKGRGKKTTSVDEGEWHVKANAHEAIITLDDYEKVQETFPVKSTKQRIIKVQRNNIFAGLLYCHNCKKRMVTRYKGERIGYVCRQRKLENKDDCQGISFGMKTLSEIVLKLLVKRIKCVLAERELVDNLKENPDYQQVLAEYRAEVKNLETEKNRSVQKQNNLYEDYASGILDKKEYLYIKEQYIKAEQKASFELQFLREKLQSYQDIEKRIKELIQMMEEFSLKSSLTKVVVQLFIERIEIGRNSTVYITFSFEDILYQVYEIIEPERGMCVC